MNALHAASNGPIWPKTAFTLDRPMPQWRAATFFPWAKAHSSREQQSRRLPSSAHAAAPFVCGGDPLRPLDPIEAAMGRTSKQMKGDFRWRRLALSRRTRPAGFSGAVKTLTLNVKAQFRPAEKMNGQGPGLPHLRRPDRVRRGVEANLEGWARLSLVKLDDPSSPAPIYASLVEIEDSEGLSLIWSRRNSD